MKTEKYLFLNWVLVSCALCSHFRFCKMLACVLASCLLPAFLCLLSALINIDDCPFVSVGIVQSVYRHRTKACKAKWQKETARQACNFCTAGIPWLTLYPLSQPTRISMLIPCSEEAILKVHTYFMPENRCFSARF